jgi:membrane-associated protein
MDWIASPIKIILHLNLYLGQVADAYGPWIYAFYERHGAKTIMLSRFLPLIRTFAPFVAGMGSMSYKKFFAYNVIGAFVWIFSVVLLGHFFGNIPYVQKNFSLVILGIVIISMIPPGIEILRGWLGGSKA